MNGYIFILFLFLFILSLLTANVPISSFRREGQTTYKAVALIILPTPLLTIARTTLLVSRGGLLQYRALFWLDFCWISLLPLLLLAVLFVPVVSL